MATKKKMLQAAAGQAGGAGLDITDVFSTYLYNGTATNVSHQIQNGIDLAGEGGLVWIKKRDSNISNTNHYLSDTERGNFQIASNSTNAQAAGDIASYNSDGWTFNASTGLGTDYLPAQSYASWTFRKAPKFFDVVTWTGTGAAMTIDHNLGQVPGMIIVKSTSATYNWAVWHREFTGTTDYIRLNLTNAKTDSAGVFGDGSQALTPTSTQFFVGGNNQVSGEVGGTYVAYLFAHNDGDGGFGPDGDQDIIKCGSYVGNGSTDGPEIDLGFEPQWLLVKQTSTSGDDWYVVDNMRGFNVSGTTARLNPNASAQEFTTDAIEPRATGFKLVKSYGAWNASGSTYIYMAIRRGPLAQPESATEVFAVEESTAGSGTLPLDIIPTIGFAPDWGFVSRNIISGSRGGTLPFIGTRLLGYGKSLLTDRSNAEGTTTIYDFATSDAPLVGDAGGANDPGAENIHWLWKRSPGFFDVVAYTGNGVAGRTVSHNLGVPPELLIVKRRDVSGGWKTYVESLGPTKALTLNETVGAENQGSSLWNSTSPTADVFTVGTNFQSNSGDAGSTYIAYLFASLDGISKVGSFSITGSGLNIDCGFTSGARFILFKRTDSAGDWWVHDTVRGINASAIDPYLKINTADAEGTNLSLVEPLASGFTVTSALGSGDYIFYAIA